MSLDQAIKHGKERRKSYRQRGKPGEFARSCRPHGGGHSSPCSYCQRARLFHALKEAQEVHDQMEQA